MNQTQGFILFFGLVAIVFLCLRPPYQWEHATYVISFQNVPHKANVQTENIGHYWIWEPPKGWEERLGGRERKSRVAIVDWPRLGVYVGVAGAIALFGAFVVFNDRFDKRRERVKANG